MLTRQPLHLSWNWQLKSSPEEIWPLITDLNRLFKDLRQPSIKQTHITQSVEPGFVQLSYNGINRYEIWEEEPYEWEYPFRFGFKRHYQSGSFKNFKVQADLQPNSSGSRLNIEIWAEPRIGILSILSTFKIKTLLKNRLRKTVQRYDKLAVHKHKPYQHAKKKGLVRSGEKRLQQILDNLHNSEVDANILQKLVNFIRRADDPELKRIHPYELADYWNLPRQQVLEVFFYAAKADLLNFNWDLHCPHCRSIQESVKTLNQIHEPIYCDKCEKEFSVNFNKTIQLSFTPHPLIRKISDKQYCLRGPQTKTHVYIQQYLDPGEKRYLKTDLPKGSYTLRTNQTQGTATIRVSEHGNDTVHIDIRSTGLSGEEGHISESPNLSIQNSSSKKQLITLEHQSWCNYSLSAAQATSSQLFRNLFSNEVLKKGEKIAVDNLTLMFTDLFDSTGMYNKEGDAKAVGQVIDHFEVLQETIAAENGAIVKTIGDSVMAVFCKPAHALRAYLRAQELLSQDDRFDNNLQLKAGIHHGSCVAVNLNSRIDYFGSTVNIASRFVDFASENEAIISEETFSEDKLHSILDDFHNDCSIDDMNTQLKGFKKESFFIKRLKVDNSPLRLAI